MLVTTIYGEMDDSLLLKLEGGFENDNEKTTWVQYHLPASGELVHRSAHVDLKEVGVTASVLAAVLG